MSKTANLECHIRKFLKSQIPGPSETEIPEKLCTGKDKKKNSNCRAYCFSSKHNKFDKFNHSKIVNSYYKIGQGIQEWTK